MREGACPSRTWFGVRVANGWSPRCVWSAQGPPPQCSTKAKTEVAGRGQGQRHDEGRPGCRRHPQSNFGGLVLHLPAWPDRGDRPGPRAPRCPTRPVARPPTRARAAAVAAPGPRGPTRNAGPVCNKSRSQLEANQFAAAGGGGRGAGGEGRAGAMAMGKLRRRISLAAQKRSAPLGSPRALRGEGAPDRSGGGDPGAL